MSRNEHPAYGRLHDNSSNRHGDGLAVDLPLILASARPIPMIGRRQLLIGGLTGIGVLSLLAACGSGSSAATTSTAGSPATTSGTTSGSIEPTSDGGSAATSVASESAPQGAPPGPPPGGSPGAPPGSGAGAASGSDTAAEVDGEIPNETGGPYPGDGTNGPNVLTESGVVRQDIRTSFGQYSGTASGIPTTIELTLVDVTTKQPIPNAAVYLWHCDQAGNYSLYSEANQNYLRGVQVSDANGKLSFTSIFPACYSGRWPHAHFEVFSSIDEAVAGSNATKTTQMAFPKETCDAVFATSGYEASIRNLSQVTLETDNVFSDGTVNEMATIGGSIDAGLTASLEVRL